MDTGCGEVVDRAGLGIGDPDRESAGQGDVMDVAALAATLARVPQVHGLALGFPGLLGAPVRDDDHAFQGMIGDDVESFELRLAKKMCSCRHADLAVY